MVSNLLNYFKEHFNGSSIEGYKRTVEKINEIALTEHGDTELLEESCELIKRASEGVSLDELIVFAFALVKEVIRRTLKLHAYDEQLIAGLALHEGRLVEMQTGEGKTLSAVFPAYLNALNGKGVHVLTFNDYLARRDAAWMGPVYRGLGLTVGYVQEGMSKEERRKAYNCDITYVTAKEAGFDYLRDFMCYHREDMVHRPFNYAVVDEADSILIDEARIPLVIAASAAETGEGLFVARDAVKKLKQGVHYTTDEYARNVYLTEEGIVHIEEILGCGNLYDPENFKLLNEVNSALHAEVLLQKDIDYIVRNDKIEMVDEFTGRVAENRHWPDALQAALETKEGLKMQSKGRIMSQMTLQGYILMYKKISGMTGTAVDSSDEFSEFYDLDVVVIPQHRTCIRKDFPDVVFTHKEAKYKAVIEEILLIHATKQPILIGTSSVKESLYLAEELKKAGVNCQVLNAKNDELEASIIEQAGALGAVTVSTNMAGRGTDIKLGGVNEIGREKVVELGGLYIIGINKHESRRIDKQLRGRAGRQGDPGMTRFFVSLEDDLMQKYGINKIIPEAIRPQKQDIPLSNHHILKRIQQVQRIVEGQNSDIRRELWKYSIILENQRMQINDRRLEILNDRSTLNILESNEPELYFNLCNTLGQEELSELERAVTLYQISESWADYLLKVAIFREGIHLNLIGGKSPIEVFRLELANEFNELGNEVSEKILKEFRELEVSKEGLKKIRERMKPPSATWTYLVNDNTFAETIGMMVIGSAGAGIAAMGAALAMPALCIEYLFSKFKKGK